MHESHQHFKDYSCNPAAKNNENDQIFGDSECEVIDIIKIIQLLEYKLINIWAFKRDKNIVKKTTPKQLDHFIYVPFINHLREWGHFIYYSIMNRGSTLLRMFQPDKNDKNVTGTIQQLQLKLHL